MIINAQTSMIFVVAMNDSRSGDFITQEDTIFISGMDSHTTEADIKQHFGAIGIIKVSFSCI